MRVLAEANGQAGWHAHAFPLSVDGVEVVASLVLLADRPTSRRPGWLPWTALAIGTAASLAANVATTGPAPISRVIAGWPAFALLLAVKLLSGMLEHRDGNRLAGVPGTVPTGLAQHGGRHRPRGQGRQQRPARSRPGRTRARASVSSERCPRCYPMWERMETNGQADPWQLRPGSAGAAGLAGRGWLQGRRSGA